MRHNPPSDFEKLLAVPRQAFPGCPQPTVRPRWPAICGGLLLALVLAAGLGAAFQWYISKDRPQAAPVPPVPARDPIKMAIVCDPSDPLSETQAEHARRLLLEDMVAQFVRGDHVLVTQLGETAEAPLQVLFSGRDPGPPGPCNPLTCSDAGAARRNEVERRDREFIVPFKAAVQRCFMPGIRGKTPLVEGLFRLGHHPDFTMTPPGMRRKAIVLTDGQQNMPGASLYEREPRKKGKQGDFTLYTPEGRRYVARHIARLQDVEVTVLRIMRPGDEARQDWRAKEWLENFLVESGARPPIQMRDLW